MTTDTTAGKARPYGAAALGVAVLAGSAVGVAAGVLGAVFDGSAGLLGGVAGAGTALLVLAAGFAVVDLVSSAMPTFSLVFALATYAFQVLVLAALLTVLRTADGIEATLAPRWFAGGVLAVALAWTVCLVWHAMRARVPLYDLPSDSPVVTPAARSERASRGVAEGGER